MVVVVARAAVGGVLVALGAVVWGAAALGGGTVPWAGADVGTGAAVGGTAVRGADVGPAAGVDAGRAVPAPV